MVDAESPFVEVVPLQLLKSFDSKPSDHKSIGGLVLVVVLVVVLVLVVEVLVDVVDVVVLVVLTPHPP